VATNGQTFVGRSRAPSDELSQVAAATGLSYDTFRRQFTRATSVSPARYRMKKRLAAARDLLLHTPLSAKQIAASLGFSSTFHFSECFMKANGMRPSEFRKRPVRGD
jgi:transcriptional regulator GlxA family with amidase domain